MLELDPDQMLYRASRMLCAQLDGETVMMDAEKGVYFGLDDIATDIWNRLEQPLSPAMLVAAMVASYDGDGADIGADVHTLLATMVENGVLSCEPEP